MKKRIKIIKKKKFSFQSVLEKISFSNQELLEIKNKVETFKNRLKIASKGKTEIFIGGSYAKGTMMKKNLVDIDIFVIFSFNEKNPSENLKNILKRMKVKFEKVHGSRDYYRIKEDKIVYEIIPIIKIKKANDAKNITDISPLHVKWLLKKIDAQKETGKKLAEEIMLAKAFCYGTKCYGAESYISGFSGYALEVLVVYYGSFLNFLKNAIKWKFNKKIVIDPEKYYKNEKEILSNLNESKLFGPLVLIDPVQKERNVCAALSEETLNVFIKNTRKFLKRFSMDFFYKKPISINKLESKGELCVVDAYTNKNKIDVIGAKLKKFFNFLVYIGKKEGFGIIKKEIEFDENAKKARFYFVVKPSKEVIIQGPPIKIEQKHILAFRKKWSNAFEKNGRLYAKIQRRFAAFENLINFIKKDKIIKQMNISGLEIVKD